MLVPQLSSINVLCKPGKASFYHHSELYKYSNRYSANTNLFGSLLAKPAAQELCFSLQMLPDLINVFSVLILF